MLPNPTRTCMRVADPTGRSVSVFPYTNLAIVSAIEQDG